MNKFVVFFALLAVSSGMAAPGAAESAARRALPALQHEEVHDEFGQYELRYVTAEGTVVSERGHLVPTPDGSERVLVVEGETSYIGDDGKTYVIKYSAGMDGSRMEGAHLPVAPEPIPVPAAEPVAIFVNKI